MWLQMGLDAAQCARQRRVGSLRQTQSGWVLKGKLRMWRSLFLAFAITLCLLGLECLVVKRATLSVRRPPDTGASSYSMLDPSYSNDATLGGAKRVIEPPEWAPFGLLSSGIVLLLYSKTLGGGGG